MYQINNITKEIFKQLLISCKDLMLETETILKWFLSNKGFVKDCF